MDRLTRQEIELTCREIVAAADYMSVTKADLQQVCDLALSALSQEAVRDEALENVLGIAGMLEFQAKLVLSNGGPDIKLDAATIVPKIVESLRVLKREPNAAGQGLATAPPVTGGPAPAAPDMASMVKDYPNLYMMLHGAVSGHYTEWPLMRKELAALLSRLGQGWIPVGWAQEHKSGRKSFYEGDLDPREVHDSGCPTYEVFKAPGASDE